MSRTRVAGVRATAVAAATVLAALSVATAPPSQANDFVNGNAFAVGVIAKIAPGVGSLGLATTAGVAVSEIKNQLAQSQAQSADLGLIGTSLTAENCAGREGVLEPEQLPHPTRVDNRKGDAEGASDEVPLAGSQLGGGREHARATLQPLAEATATMSALSVDPVIAVNGGQSHAATRIVDHKAREAVASVDANVDLGGVVQLRGLRWDAIHRTGADGKVEGTFAIDGVSIGGAAVPVSADQLAPVEAAINQALAPTGLSVKLPKVERLRDPADLIRVTPLRIVLQDSPLGATLLRPVLGLTRAQKEKLFDTITKAYCSAAAALLVGDITISALAGAGFLAFEIGGVEATTAEVVYTDPFGTDLPLPDLNLPGLPFISSDILGTPAAPFSVGSAAGPRPVATTGPVERVCESVHPFKWPSCSRGAAGALGVLGVAVTAAVAALDWRHQRRRARSSAG